jgi:Spy/CpxP family protein refolding chaperone
MKSKLCFFAAFTIAFGWLTLQPLAAASDADSFSARDGERPFLRLIKTVVRSALNFQQESPLSSEQRNRMRQVLASHRLEIHDQMVRMQDAHEALQIANSKSAINEGEVFAAAARIGEASRQGALLRAKVARELRPILTEEQRTRFEEGRAEIRRQIEALLDVRS